MNSYQTPPMECPECLKMMEAATSVGGVDDPAPGDLSLCIYCGAPLKFGDKLELLRLTDDDMKALGEDERRQVLLAQKVVLMLIAERLVK